MCAMLASPQMLLLSIYIPGLGLLVFTAYLHLSVAEPTSALTSLVLRIQDLYFHARC